AKNDDKCAPSPHVDVHMTSAVEGQTVDQDVKCIIDCEDVSKLIGKRILLVDTEMQHVADGILISTEIEKVVMGRKIGTEYCEVSITHAQRPNTSLFVKDQFRKRLSDALGSHILWLKDYVSYGPSMMLLGFDFMLTNIAGLHTLTISMNIAGQTFYFEIHWLFLLRQDFYFKIQTFF
ncbi:hypothetical protein Taro_011878, partial [Colocasia esculenta]|nr:hypothetical protein [Colocasia esculenta]